MSTKSEGHYTRLRAFTLAQIIAAMDDQQILDMDRLKADMAVAVNKSSARKFSRAATWGKNLDFYRNFTKAGQDKRLSAEVYLGIVRALGKDPWEYVIGEKPDVNLPSAAVLMNTFALLLDSLGIDPLEDGRAQKLASQFPNALRSTLALRARTMSDGSAPLAEAAPDGDGDQAPS